MKMLLLFPALLGPAWIGLLAGCASPAFHDPESPYFRYPPGASLILLHPVEIPPGETTLRLQGGRTVARNAVDEFEPHCILEIETVSETAQPLSAGRFKITRVERLTRSFSGMPSLTLFIGLGRGSLPSQRYYVTEFRLHSDALPQVRSLTCQHDQGAAGVLMPRHLKLSEIRAALGEGFRLDLP